MFCVGEIDLGKMFTNEGEWMTGRVAQDGKFHVVVLWIQRKK